MRHEPAPIGPRCAAALVDGLIVLCLAFMALVLATIVTLILGIGGPLIWLVTAFVAACGYLVATMLGRGQTLGHQLLDLRVVRDDGRPLTLSTVLLREVLVKLLVGCVTFGLTWLWALVDRRGRSLHDIVASTRVVSVRRVSLAPPIARHVHAAEAVAVGIERTVHQAGLPFTDVCAEARSLVGTMRGSAERAQLIYEALVESPPEHTEHRLAQVASGSELAAALREQLAVQRRMVAQLHRYGEELERVVVELDTVRGNLLGISATTDPAYQRRLADDVRELRLEVAAIGDGFSEVYG